VLFGLALLALGVSLASGAWRQLAMPGKLHHAHASFEDNCSACHAPFQPTTSRNPLQAALGTGPVADELCQKCHAGPPHHPGRELAGEAGRCASCHAEHRGRHAPLRVVRDSACTRCHSDLGAHVQGGNPQYENRITGFATDHPPFRLGAAGARKQLGEAGDPGKLRFNHKAHLTPGARYDPQDSRGWALKDIQDRELRERYRRQQPEKKSDEALVVLSCASCHQLDAGDAPPPGPGQSLPRRTEGDTMLPVHYDQHCKACHPLTFRHDLPGAPVPHLLQPPAVNRFLWGAIAERDVKRLAPKGSSRPLPGENLSRLEKQAREAVRSGVAHLEGFLYQDDLRKAKQYVYEGKAACGLCHYFEPQNGIERAPERVLPTNVPEVWFPHAKFSHRAHRAVECSQCHGGADKSTVHTDVLLPGVDNCKACHAPARVENGQPKGGARHDCVTCHSFHNGDAPLAGRGAQKRGAKRRGSIQDFLGGK
jgi:hypothetical protein